jgi:hypothetical protein
MKMLNLIQRKRKRKRKRKPRATLRLLLQHVLFEKPTKSVTTTG